MREKEKLWCMGNHSQLLDLSVDRSLSPLERVNECVTR